MTSRERVEAALNHKQPDRTPIFEYVLLSPVADIVIGHKYMDYGGDYRGWLNMAEETGWERALRQYVSDRLELAEKLGHDMLYVVPNPPPGILKQEIAADKKSGNEMLQETSDPVEKLLRRNELNRQTIGKFDEDRFLVYYYLFEEMKKRGIDLPIKAPAYVHGIWTDVDLMQTMVLEPEAAHEHFKLATERAIPDIKKYLEIGIKQIGIGGDFSGNRLLISPESYKCFIVPHLKILSDMIHQYGGWAINASDGNLWPVIDDFLVNSGVDGYIEIDMRAGMELKKLKTEYGHMITLYGNMDCGEVLSFAEPEEIRNYTIECIENGWSNGGHIFTASNAITGSVKLENYMSMVNAYRDIFNLPPLKV